MPDEELHEPPLKAFNDTIAYHGYALPQAIMQAAEVARGESQFPHRNQWKIEPIEFPVSVKGHDSRIDLLFRHEDNRWLMVGECKRTNPDYGEWCFSRYRRTGPLLQHQPSVQALHRNAHYKNDIRVPVASIDPEGREVCDLGLVVPGKKQLASPKDKKQDRDQLEDACAQACRGVSGLTNLIAKVPTLFENREMLRIFPVVFTTARLWFGKSEFWRADLKTGLPPEVTELEQVDWLYYQYPMSPGLMHDVQLGKEPDTLAEYVSFASLRTIIIVHAPHAQEFFQRFHPRI